jgi:hypothetical protein
MFQLSINVDAEQPKGKQIIINKIGVRCLTPDAPTKKIRRS